MPLTDASAAPRPGRRWRLAPLFTTGLAAVLVTGCGLVSTVSPAPTPADFPGVAIELVKRGLVIDHLVSGDAGCDDPVLTPTAIGFDASGLDQQTVIRAHIYIFRDRATYDRLRTSVDSCARSFVTDPETYESAETSPFVVAAQGPWGPKFEAALRAGLEAAAGTGG
jgi:hypothetical protein